MKLGLMIGDVDYRDALVKKLSTYDNDIFVNIIGSNIRDASGAVILTDVPASGLEKNVLEVLKPRTVFMISSEKGACDDCNTVFKFSSIHEIISELSLVYNRWRGNGPGINHTGRLITICSESDAYSTECCRTLAGQIIYSRGGRVFILPLSYINDYGVDEALRSNSLSRLLYSIKRGRENGLEGITYTDSYGVSSLLLSKGHNPVAYLDEDELRTLVSGLSGKYDTIIADAATCFRKENIEVMKESEKIVVFEKGRRVTGIEKLLDREIRQERLIRVNLKGGTEDALAMDECLKQIYGT